MDLQEASDLGRAISKSGLQNFGGFGRKLE
eukprot:SAG31_NODE_40687_length_279_cov_1.100000_1_plen_29_part_10